LQKDWNKTFSKLLEKAGRAAEQKARIKLYRQADRILVKEAAVMPFTYGRMHLLVKPWVVKYPVSPLRWLFLKDVVIESH